MREFTYEKKKQLAALLVEYSISELRADERIATNDLNLERLRELAQIQTSIDTVLDSLN